MWGDLAARGLACGTDRNPMVNGNGNFSVQTRAAGEMGGGRPSMTPGGGDRKWVLILGVLVVGVGVALALLG